VQVAVTRDEIQQIAVLASGSIGPFTGGAGTVIGTLQTDIKAAAGGVLNIADDPVTAQTVPPREVMTAHGLGIAREAAREIGSADHSASPDQAAAWLLACRRVWRPRIAGGITGVGVKQWAMAETFRERAKGRARPALSFTAPGSPLAGLPLPLER
jgi:hypothetical protein